MWKLQQKIAIIHTIIHLAMTSTKPICLAFPYVYAALLYVLIQHTYTQVQTHTCTSV